MTALKFTEIVRAQFLKKRDGKSLQNLRFAEIAIVLASVGLGALNCYFGVATTNVGDLLTASSIITGLTFAMAMSFWDKRIAIGTASQTTGHLNRKDMIESLSVHLIWTVMVGVVATACLGYAALVSDTKVEVPLTSICAGLLGYQLMLVAEALVKLYNSSIELST